MIDARAVPRQRAPLVRIVSGVDSGARGVFAPPDRAIARFHDPRVTR